MCAGQNLYDLIPVLAVIALFAWMWWVMFNSERNEKG
jgi:hypothetical protein